MGTFFTVIQFVPDPVANERLNAGLIVYTDQVVKFHFSHNWKRLERFSNPEKVEFFRDFEQEMANRTKGDAFSACFTKDDLEKMIRKWGNLIQFTTPRGSLLEPEPLLKQILPRFLPADTDSEAATSRNTGQLLKKTVRATLQKSIRSILGKKSPLKVKANIGVSGNLVNHRFPIGIVNGVPRLAAQLIQFDDRKKSEKCLERIHATAWTFREILEQPPEKRPILAVIIDEADSSRLEFKEARQAFEKIKVEMVAEPDLKRWADETVSEISKHDPAS